MANGVVTLLEVRDACKAESDEQGTSNGGAFITDAEWNGYIQRSYQELYGLVVGAYGNDYYSKVPTPHTFTTDGVNNFFALPEDLFKLLGVDVQVNQTGQRFGLSPFAFAERNMFSWVGAQNNSAPQAGQRITVWYVPRLQVPTLDGDLIDGVNGWEDYIIAKSCILALAKEESDTSNYWARVNALIARLKSETENRDAGRPSKIVDVRSNFSYGMRYRLEGNKIWLIGGVGAGWGFPFFGPNSNWEFYY